MSLTRKIDFAVIVQVTNANPNGDPLNGNRPRANFDGIGEMSDVCLKRKIRDCLTENGETLYVQSDRNRTDESRSLKERFVNEFPNSKKLTSKEIAETSCETWFDVRSFGQVFAYKLKSKDADGLSIPIRGPVTIQSAYSVAPVEIVSNQITKSVNGETKNEKNPDKMSSDRMGMKHRITSGTYVFKGSMNAYLAAKTGFTNEDAMKIKEQLVRIFENDESSARPAGSMEVTKVIWWEHNCKSGQYSSGKVHKSLTVNNDGTYKLENLEGLVPEEIDGF